jgi:hypothetical protein
MGSEAILDGERARLENTLREGGGEMHIVNIGESIAS